MRTFNPYEPPHCDDVPPTDSVMAMFRFFFLVSIGSVIAVVTYILHDLSYHNLLAQSFLFVIFIVVFAIMIMIILTAMYFLGKKGMKRHDVNSLPRS